MDYHKDTKMDSNASSQSVSDSIQEAKQTMVSPVEGYDPNRIPLSIFASKPSSNPLEWSLASSESLFSITLGKSESNFPSYYKSSSMYKSMDATDNNVITMDSQTQEELQEIVDEKMEEEEKERISKGVINKCSVVELISDDEISEDNESSEDTDSMSMQDNQDLSTSYEFHRSEDRSWVPSNNPPSTIEIEEDAQEKTNDQAPNKTEIEIEGDRQSKTDEQAPNASSGCFPCCFSWKLVCCAGYLLRVHDIFFRQE